jgi:hypothetical protein
MRGKAGRRRCYLELRNTAADHQREESNEERRVLAENMEGLHSNVFEPPWGTEGRRESEEGGREGGRVQNDSPIHWASFSTKHSSKGRREDKGCPLSIDKLVRKSLPLSGAYLLMPYFHLKFPRKCPKSMWKSSPVRLSMMLSLCLSPMPITKVATQYPMEGEEGGRISSTCA